MDYMQAEVQINFVGIMAGIDVVSQRARSCAVLFFLLVRRNFSLVQNYKKTVQGCIDSLGTDGGSREIKPGAMDKHMEVSSMLPDDIAKDSM